MDTTYPKDFTVEVEFFKGNVKETERIFGENVLVGNVAEVKEGVQSLGEIGGDKTFKHIHKDLPNT